MCVNMTISAKPSHSSRVGIAHEHQGYNMQVESSESSDYSSIQLGIPKTALGKSAPSVLTRG